MSSPNSNRAWSPTSVRFRPSELVEVTACAEALRISRSTLLRRATLTLARELEALPR